MANAKLLSSTIGYLLVLFLVAISLNCCRGQSDAANLVTERVIYGEPAAKGRFPYMCSVRRNSRGSHICGGVLVDTDWMMTAAHCLDLDKNSIAEISPFIVCDILERVEQNVSKSFTTRQCYLHHLWNGDALDGADIALCELDKSADLSIPTLASVDQVFTERDVFAVLGWGNTSFNSGPADVLQIGESLRYLSNSACNDLPTFSSRIKESMICSGRGIVDTCEGDSGGPLLELHNPVSTTKVDMPSLDRIVGITSFGHRACQGAPGVYTRVSCFRPWIECIMEGKGQDCDEHIPCCSGIKRSSNFDEANALNRIGKAIQSDDSDTVKRILCEGLSPNAVFSDSSDSLLIRAARQSANKSAKVLLEHEANTEYKNSNGWTPLHTAAAYDSLGVAKELLAFGANLESRSDRRRTPLHLAAERGSLQVAKELVNNKANIETRLSGGGTPVASAAYFGHVLIVQFLLDKGAIVDSVNNIGRTALHWASARGKVSTVEILLDNGASKTKTTNAGETPFELICSANTLPRPCTDDEISNLRRMLLVT